ncbi:hypothetical protein SARC_12661 [Sphaeroforma arctica JP610]|uniref:Uncharacterized protein n=1 Tax=Sphaeroforma arctica JP610 TaxID=667725 RepID=A0A0L0FE89_9EUKA|nr:hypothetical protein SARC_12661 [Sphaeroforma arctica JP610]KNC74801.1 hypothetical protein SARC_12661 [Sphaeroforma arctica JP610]|eukprot:XP_014148703.1 hypothetical protein SARC_12661 [Sphaeroforma arctica JP610]
MPRANFLQALYDTADDCFANIIACNFVTTHVDDTRKFLEDSLDRVLEDRGIDMMQFSELNDALQQAQKKWRTKAKNTVAAATQELFDVFEMNGTIKPSIPNLESAIKTLATLISPDNPKLKIMYRDQMKNDPRGPKACCDNLSVALMTLRESLLRLWSLVKRYNFAGKLIGPKLKRLVDLRDIPRTQETTWLIRGIREIRLDGEREALDHAERMERMRDVERAYAERLRKVIGVDATDENGNYFVDLTGMKDTVPLLVGRDVSEPANPLYQEWQRVNRKRGKRNQDSLKWSDFKRQKKERASIQAIELSD